MKRLEWTHLKEKEKREKNTKNFQMSLFIFPIKFGLKILSTYHIVSYKIQKLAFQFDISTKRMDFK